MSYCKNLVRGDYSTNTTDKVLSFFQAFRDFLVSQNFVVQSEDYITSGSITLVLERDILGIKLKQNTSSITDNYINIQIYVNATDGTMQNLRNISTFAFTTEQSTDYEGRAIYVFSSTVMVIDNKDSFMIVIGPSNKNISTNTNVVAGVVHYDLLDGTKTSAGFYSGSSAMYVAKEQTVGDTIIFANSHIAISDDAMVYEQKLNINQNNFFIGDTSEVVGLVGAEKGKIYQTSQGKYFAFNNDMAMLMGDEML